MMADIAREMIANNIVEGKERVMCSSSKTLNRIAMDAMAVNQSSASSEYTLAEDQSTFSRDIDHWMNGGDSVIRTSSPPIVTSTPRPAQVQRSVLATSSSIENHGLWYFLAMVLPLFSISCPHWRCTPSVVLNTAELMLAHISRATGRIREQFNHISQDGGFAREIFATLMDIVLVIYATGFLIISLYQASILD